MSSEGLFDDKFRVAVLIVRFIALPVLACCMLGSLWLLKSWKVYDVSHRVWFNVAVTTTFLYLVFANCLWFTSPESTRLPTRSVPIFATFTGLFYFVPRLMTFVAITCFAATFTSVLSHRRRYKTFNEWASGLLFGLLFLDIVVRAMDVNNSIHYDTSKGSRWITYSGRSGLLADISRVLEVLLLAAYLLAVLVVVCSSFRTSTWPFRTALLSILASATLALVWISWDTTRAMERSPLSASTDYTNFLSSWNVLSTVLDTGILTAVLYVPVYNSRATDNPRVIHYHGKIEPLPI